MQQTKNYYSIVRHYEDCLEKYGDSHLGVDWADINEAERRYEVMLEVIKYKYRGRTVRLLDFGCGTSALLDYINKRNWNNIVYSGLDISSRFIEVSRKKYPDVQYYNLDILDDNIALPCFDFIVMNGVLTEKLDLPFSEMFYLFTSLVKKVKGFCNIGIAFNIRSSYVEKKDDDLFYLSMDLVTQFLAKEITKKFLLRNDYGIDEYTVYAYLDNL